MREKILEEEERQPPRNLRRPHARMDPIYEREARQLDAAIERTEAQLKAKDAEAKALRARNRECRKGDSYDSDPD